MLHRTKALFWFRQDLRLADNPGLDFAVQAGYEIIPLYIYDEKTAGEWAIGGASKWWLHHSLQSLSQDLKEMGSTLILRRGAPLQVIEEMISSEKISAVFWNRCYEPYAIERDSFIKKTLKNRGLACQSFNGSLLIEPWEISTKTGAPYKVFTQFWNSCLKSLCPGASLPKALIRPVKEMADSSDRLLDLTLLPERPNWAKGFKDWLPGERGAMLALKSFLKGSLRDYPTGRDHPQEIGTSRLSPHLHFGEISPRQIWNAIEQTFNKDHSLKPSSDKYLSEIGWREFSYHLLYHFPTLPSVPFVERFRQFPWSLNDHFFKAWTKGQTGYPIVDAGMRELWSEGWMHNRVRMIAASFLTKHLLIDWRKGAKWFWDTLVDADLASNSASWQWVAGCGADAAPYFRIFNPILQGEKFDPEGEYTKKWVPELKGLPAKYLHRPWEAPELVLRQAGLCLGDTYPFPIVDHKTSRELALKHFSSLTKKELP